MQQILEQQGKGPSVLRRVSSVEIIPQEQCNGGGPPQWGRSRFVGTGYWNTRT